MDAHKHKSRRKGVTQHKQPNNEKKGIDYFFLHHILGLNFRECLITLCTKTILEALTQFRILNSNYFSQFYVSFF